MFHLQSQCQRLTCQYSDLTGTAPNPPNDSAVGLSHAWPVKTSYYDAAIPIWIDEIAEAASWSADFLKPEAREVLGVLGAFVFCFRRPLDEAELVFHSTIHHPDIFAASCNAKGSILCRKPSKTASEPSRLSVHEVVAVVGMAYVSRWRCRNPPHPGSSGASRSGRI